MPNMPLKGDYNTYIGARYVPIIGGMWNQQTEYEPLTIVMYQGSSYTSKTFVPKGTQIDNTTYWVRTANYDEQVEFYRSEVQQYKKDIDASEAEYIATVQKAQEEFTTTTNKNIEEFKSSTTAENARFKNQINSDYSSLQNQVNALVLSAGNSESSDAELVQSRAAWNHTYSTLADRLNNGVINNTSIGLSQEAINTTDWNDLPVNYVVTCGHSGTTTDLHAPENNFQGNVLTITGNSSNNGFKTQIAIKTAEGHGVPTIYVRDYYNAWSEWHTVAYDAKFAELVQSRAAWNHTYSTLADRLNNGVINNTSIGLSQEAVNTTDWNDLPVNYVVTCGHLGTTTDLHAPENNFEGNVLTITGNSSNNGFKTQIAIKTAIGDGVPTIYVRDYYNAWSEWHTVAYNENLINYTDIYVKYHSGNISAFPRFGVIGDSYASGEVYSSDLKHRDNYWLSWGQQLARTLGNTCENYSAGGCTSAWWFTDKKCYTKFQNDDPCDLYLIAMGINDPGRSSTTTIGTIDDIKNGDDNADTFYGQYARLIQTCKAKNSNALIVCIKTMQTTQNTNYNNAIAEIANHFGVPVINPLDHPYFHSIGFKTMVSGHPTAFDYGAIGNAINELFSECTLNNDNYFKNWGYNKLTNES